MEKQYKNLSIKLKITDANDHQRKNLLNRKRSNIIKKQQKVNFIFRCFLLLLILHVLFTYCSYYSIYCLLDITCRCILLSHCCCQKTVQFMEELKRIIPNSEVRVRKGLDLKKIIPQAKEKGFTALVVVNEDRKLPSILFICVTKLFFV